MASRIGFDLLLDDDDPRTAVRKPVPEATLRLVPLLRRTRAAGLFVLLVAVVLWFPLQGDFGVPQDSLIWCFVLLGAVTAIWFLTSRPGEGNRAVPACLVTAGCAVMAGFLVNLWWTTFSRSSFSMGMLLAQAMAALGLGAMTTADLTLRGIRHSLDSIPGDFDDPARIHPLSPGKQDSDPPWPGPTGNGRRTGRIVLTLAPTVVLALLVAAFHFVAPAIPVSHTTVPAPDGDPPARPTSIGTGVAWSRDIPGLLEVAAGAAGPVILTKEGIAALDPGDGSTLWSYRRPGARYTRIAQSYGDNGPVNSYLITSPNRRHVALAIAGPQDKEKDSYSSENNNHLVIVLDTLTGRITGEHPSTGLRIQLTDSVILTGNTGHSLIDGRRLWSIEGSGRVTSQYDCRAYCGPAGHKSLVLRRDGRNLTLIPDTDPTATTVATNITLDRYSIGENPLVIANGWTVRHTEALPEDEGDLEFTPVSGWHAQAVTLDSLAGLEDEQPVDLGRTAGLNSVASRATGTLALRPADDENSFNKIERAGGPWVGAVFDPATRTVTPASEYAGPAVAKIGLVAGRDGGAIALQPGDGSAGATIPIAPGSTHRSPDALLRDRSNGYSPVQLYPRSSFPRATTTFVTTPGLTLVILDPTTGLYDRPEEPRSPHRLYGVPGGPR